MFPLQFDRLKQYSHLIPVFFSIFIAFRATIDLTFWIFLKLLLQRLSILSMHSIEFRLMCLNQLFDLEIDPVLYMCNIAF